MRYKRKSGDESSCTVFLLSAFRHTSNRKSDATGRISSVGSVLRVVAVTHIANQLAISGQVAVRLAAKSLSEQCCHSVVACYRRASHTLPATVRVTVFASTERRLCSSSCTWYWYRPARKIAGSRFAFSQSRCPSRRIRRISR